MMSYSGFGENYSLGVMDGLRKLGEYLGIGKRKAPVLVRGDGESEVSDRWPEDFAQGVRKTLEEGIGKKGNLGNGSLEQKEEGNLWDHPLESRVYRP